MSQHDAEIERVKQSLDRIILLGHRDPALVMDAAKSARALIDALDEEADDLAASLQIEVARTGYASDAMSDGARNGFHCPDCKHNHQGPGLGSICIGCACERTAPPEKGGA